MFNKIFKIYLKSERGVPSGVFRSLGALGRGVGWTGSSVCVCVCLCVCLFLGGSQALGSDPPGEARVGRTTLPRPTQRPTPHIVKIKYNIGTEILMLQYFSCLPLKICSYRQIRPAIDTLVSRRIFLARSQGCRSSILMSF